MLLLLFVSLRVSKDGLVLTKLSLVLSEVGLVLTKVGLVLTKVGLVLTKEAKLGLTFSGVHGLAWYISV